MTGAAALIVAAIGLILLLVLVVLLLALRKQVAELADVAEAKPRRSNGIATEADSQPLLEEIGKALLHTNEQIASFDIVFSDIQSQLAKIGNDLQDLKVGARNASPTVQRLTESPVAERTEAPAASRPAPVLSEQPARDSQDVGVPAAQEAPAPATESEGWPGTGELKDGGPTQPQPEPARFEPAVVAVSSSASLLDQYRQLIAEPRKAEINRWADDCGGASCIVNEDGSLSSLPRDAGGLLVAIPDGNGDWLILPGGRMVVEFATSFANMISMRSVTRDCFELTADGSGILRLVEPARASANGERWRVTSRGSLSGFTT